MIPLSLYIHFPWCVRKCPYCDFNSHTAPHEMPEEQYLERLIADLALSLPHTQGRMLHSIFMGGGTPSLFSASTLEKLLTHINNKIAFEEDIEITLEANPGTIDESRFKDYFSIGINRLSIGVQSFNEKHLKKLGRIHNQTQAQHAIERALSAGFENFNIDLMHGLPEQTEQEALEDIACALQFSPPHLSWYQLTIEPNTAFYKAPPNLPDDEVLANIQEAGENLLAQNHYQHYEISAFAKAHHQSKHNRNYWQFGDYLGIGAGAHSKITQLDSGNIKRAWRTRHPRDYLDPNKKLIAETTMLSQKQLPFEFMMNAMRLNEPITTALLLERTGLTFANIEKPLNEAIAKGLIELNTDMLSVTPLGRRFLNDLLQLFM